MVAEAIYIVFCLILAYINRRLILYDKKILHGINGLLHFVFWGVTLWLTRSWFPVVVLPFLGRLFFDASLSVMRGLPVDYVAQNPKSIIDKIEKKLFGMDGLLPKIIYIIIITVLNILHGSILL